MGSLAFTPAVQQALNIAVLNKFGSGFFGAANRVSGLLNIAGIRPVDSENIVTLVVGKNLKIRRRGRNTDEARKRKVNIYEQRAKLAPYFELLTVDLMDARYGKLEQLLITSETAGAAAAEAPTRAIETLIPFSLSLACHTKKTFFAVDHPVRPGSSQTWANLANLGPLDFDSYDLARQMFMQMPDEDGNACGSQPTVLAVGPKYENKGLDIVQNRRPLAFAGENLRTDQKVELVVVPNWGDEFWCLFDTRLDSDRPAYFAEGRALRAGPLFTDPEGPTEKLTGELSYLVDGDIAVALGNPRRAFMAANPANKTTIAAKYKKHFEMNDFGFDLS
jgi:hypothetical protein